MLTYLDKFNSLPQEIRGAVEAEPVLSAIEEIEKKYDVSLASAIMRVMVKEISIIDLPKFFVFEFNLDGRTAEELVSELKEKVFLGAADYLGFAVDEKAVASNSEQYSAWAQNKRSEADVQSSSFFFSPEDEEEVRALAKKVEVFSPSKEEIKREDGAMDQKIEKIKKQLKVSFSSEELNSRFKKIMETYLKGIRNKIDTKQTLIKTVDSGGLSMDPIYVDNILLVADKINLEIIPEQKKEDEKIDRLNLRNSGVRDFDYDFGSLGKKHETDKDNLHFTDEGSILQANSENENAKEAKIKEEKTDNDLIDLSGGNEKKGEKYAREESLLNAEEGFTIKEENSAPVNNIANARQNARQNKARLQDVKFKPKLTGPIEEIGELDLTNFRRLNPDPEIATEKIKQKIKLLEDENYAKSLSGKKSWRSSPINQLYLAIGQQSLAEKKAVPEIISDRQANGQEALSYEEFDALVRLNKALKY